MKISYDRASDALRFVFAGTTARRRELGDGIYAEYDAGGQLVVVEVSDASRRIRNLSATRHVILEELGPPIAQGQPPSTIVANHIVLDERGVAWIDDTNIKVIEVVMDRIAWEWSPEAIHRQHPQLSLAQIHAALSYYYDHQAEFDAAIEGLGKEVEVMKTAEANETPAPPETSGREQAAVSVQLYMDVHVPSAITKGLRARGVDVLTAQQDGTTKLFDPQLLDRAAVLGRVLFSQDSDLLREAVRRQRTNEFFAGVVYGHQQNVTLGQCIKDLELMAKVLDVADLANQVVYLPP